ncbi:Putative 2/3 transmembrane domain holin [Pseudomonas sp. NFPP10]|uniref:putative holin n=1 Tax=unclassified Pseudomonas TaxID=196821 RepID=UPI00088A5A91|nr:MULTISPECIES: putative holin [unclassified Pseudomonas]SDA18164.1 Putative 2/3 transmembrane domain holin [Pseudomonas sp. NFPP12]SEK99483.1 Putative 2/3 transmembrane domain holin [Pseudomonas sp. NFPP10]SFI58114.1 Putative 2/3 transmembrane domain holin [Pseudomonas sp. NFPP08]SFM43141.1 Putative 2/3 transmembrane domain holin [Pseudomonas sp. NFPP05]SFX31588.1 Putative 2/3 transmembrane domain holin [Pseudomonas sp. NFPP09]
MAFFHRRPRAPRMTFWSLITVVLLLCLALVAPTKMVVVLYKAGLVTLGGVLGYWIDRALFPYARPDQVLPGDRALAGMRRALVVLACILGLTLGL